MKFQLTSKEYIQDNRFISYTGLLRDSKKSSNHLAPIFEAFTNALEAFAEEQVNRVINIEIYKKTSDMFDKLVFDKLVIKDNGDGFNDTNFSRIISYKDISKGAYNKGSGKIQYLLFFNLVEIKSIFREDNKFYCREFDLSGCEDFLTHNAIILHKNTYEIESDKCTSVTFNKPLSKNSINFYNGLDAVKLKKELKKRYLQLFCLHRNNLPTISIKEFHDDEEFANIQIASSDIPEFDKTATITLQYQEVNECGDVILLNGETEVFNVYSFKLPASECDANAIKLTVKDEIIDKKHLEFKFLL